MRNVGDLCNGIVQVGGGASYVKFYMVNNSKKQNKKMEDIRSQICTKLSLYYRVYPIFFLLYGLI